MESTKFRRKKYFIHSSTQLKYICMSILPALLIAVFCIFLSINSGLLLSNGTKYKALASIDSVSQKVDRLIRENPSPDKGQLDRLLALRKDLLSSRLEINETHYRFLNEWNQTMFLMIGGILAVLVCVGVLSLLYSHRIAGPIFRIKRCIDTLSQGKEVPPPVRLRDYDEFKELADSLNKLMESTRTR